MSYRHVEVESLQASKREGEACGDSAWVRRSVYHTTFVLADGIGSGIKAHIASQMSAARLGGLLKGGASPRDAFTRVAATMSGWRDHSLPFAAFLVGRILNNGMCSVLAYEMPPPLLINSRGARVLDGKPLVVPAGLAAEYQCRVLPSEGLLAVSDGIVQAGMGGASSQGWTSEALEAFLNQWSRLGQPFHALARDVMREAAELDGPLPGDDKTVLLAHTRQGSEVRVLTGPPLDRAQDAAVARAFLDEDAVKVLCGATTADIVSREAGLPLEMEGDVSDYSTPPRCFMRQVDLVTEGAVTLTQAYNLLDQGLSSAGDRSAASELAGLLAGADCVRFTVGRAINPAHRDLGFLKQGILARSTVVPLMAAALEGMGKLVTVEWV